MFRSYTSFILITVLYFIASMWISVFPHEFAHSTTAWLFGFKESPLDIYYGNFNWQNVIFVTGIDENVNYSLIKAAGRPDVVGWTAFAALTVTFLFYILSLVLLNINKIKKHPYIYYFLFWINVLNLSELTSYIVLRSFSTHGDMANFEYGTGITPLGIFTVGGVFVSAGIIYLFRNILKNAYLVLKLTKPKQILLLVLTAFFIFGHGGVRMLLYSYGSLSSILGGVFFLLMIFAVFYCWPKSGTQNNKISDS